MKTITLNGVDYIEKQAMAEGQVIIRSRDSGVHFGTLASRDGSEVALHNSRRIWYWSGAASLNQMAVNGVSNPQECKFSIRVPVITVLGVCEILPCTSSAAANIEEVPEWTA